MSKRKMKSMVEEQMKSVEKYLKNEINIADEAEEMSVEQTMVKQWIGLYEYDGPS